MLFRFLADLKLTLQWKFSFISTSWLVHPMMRALDFYEVIMLVDM